MEQVAEQGKLPGTSGEAEIEGMVSEATSIAEPSVEAVAQLDQTYRHLKGVLDREIS